MRRSLPSPTFTRRSLLRPTSTRRSPLALHPPGAPPRRPCSLRCCPCGLCPCSRGCCPRGLCSCPCCLRRRPRGCLRRCPRLHRLQLRLRPRGPCLSSLKKTTRLTQHTPQDFIQRRNRTEHAVQQVTETRIS